MLTPSPLTSEFIGMAGYAPASFHNLIDDEVKSDDSSIGDLRPPSRPLSWECALADAPGQLPEVAESQRAHTAPDPHEVALVCAKECHTPKFMILGCA